MSKSTTSLRRKIKGAGDLQSVVRTMRAVSATSIEQFTTSVQALSDYYRTVELGLSACFRDSGPAPSKIDKESELGTRQFGAIVFGSDQGLVGQFNDLIADYAIETLADLPGKPHIWTVGERVHARLADSGLPLMALFGVPNSVKAITPLVGQIQIESEMHRAGKEYSLLYVFHNRPKSGAIYEQVCQRLLPLDAEWQRGFSSILWPTACLPQFMNTGSITVRALIREYLFISLFRVCAESLASEHASRLAAMQRADKNIDELLEELNRKSHRLRQSAIDEELFDVVSGFEALREE